ncbi:Beta-galactosidase C-terminal domain [Streptomyces canus]|uniref:Beta-galactosidase C-terminal domain n=1 Tax=Streptomyces canus TaxID=58343 RepID=UPI0033AEC35A
MTLRPAQQVEQRTPALTAVPGPQQELGGVAVERPMRHLTAAPRGAHPYGALVARLLGETGVGPETPGLPPQVEAVTRHAAEGRRWHFLINHGTESVPLPEPAHDLLTGGTVAELAAGGSAVLRIA